MDVRQRKHIISEECTAENTVAPNFPIILIRFSEQTSQQAIDWLHKRITASHFDGGCGLNVLQNVDENKVLFFISANKERILRGADEINIRKFYKDGSLRDFSVLDKNNFKNFEDEDFFLECEQQRIITQSLKGIRADEESHVPGHEHVHLYKGKSILQRLISKNLVTDFFPLHNLEALRKLNTQMYGNIRNFNAPLKQIQCYYGDSVAVYFSFLNFYLRSLLYLALLSIVYWVLVGAWEPVDTFVNSVDDNWIVSLMHLTWAVTFLVAWTRKSVQYAFDWGSLGMKTVEKPRMAFRGDLGKNPVTNELEPQYESWKRNLRICFISLPIVFICNMLAIATMFYYFNWEVHMIGLFKLDDSYYSLFMQNLPSILYSILIQIANALYQQLAENLTHAENHKYEKNYQNALIFKTLLFNFVNNFLVLFYIAFVYRDMVMLSVTLRNLFLMDIAINQLVECILPAINFKLRTFSKKNKQHDDYKKTDKKMSLLEQARIELQKDTYTSTFEDYLELWLQFGYVMLFSCAYPPAAYFTIINNFIEQQTDAYKLNNLYRRPFARQTDGIKAWENAFNILVYLSIVTNLALIVFSPRFFITFYEFFPEGTTVHVVILFILLEHTFLLGRFLISYFISSVPSNIKLEMNKYRYQTRILLKKSSSFSPRINKNISEDSGDHTN